MANCTPGEVAILVLLYVLPWHAPTSYARVLSVLVQGSEDAVSGTRGPFRSG